MITEQQLADAYNERDRRIDTLQRDLDAAGRTAVAQAERGAALRIGLMEACVIIPDDHAKARADLRRLAKAGDP